MAQKALILQVLCAEANNEYSHIVICATDLVKLKRKIT